LSIARGIGGEDLGRETSMTKVGVATLIGALVEWYDYSLCSLAASVGLFRPVGGAIFGHYGDRLGRKAILVLTLLLVGVGPVALYVKAAALISFVSVYLATESFREELAREPQSAPT
jgi:MFS family permease